MAGGGRFNKGAERGRGEGGRAGGGDSEGERGERGGEEEGEEGERGERAGEEGGVQEVEVDGGRGEADTERGGEGGGGAGERERGGQEVEGERGRGGAGEEGGGAREKNQRRETEGSYRTVTGKDSPAFGVGETDPALGKGGRGKGPPHSRKGLADRKQGPPDRRKGPSAPHRKGRDYYPSPPIRAPPGTISALSPYTSSPPPDDSRSWADAESQVAAYARATRCPVLTLRTAERAGRGTDRYRR
eukprot:2916250-Rhodomonas_salina.1